MHWMQAAKSSPFFCSISRNSVASRVWQLPQTWSTDCTPGGAAPWLPWQSLHVGAVVSPLSYSARACTLVRLRICTATRAARTTSATVPVATSAAAAKVAARVAAELGADWVKVPYVEGFRRVVESCFVPVVVLGGPASAGPQATLAMIKAALQAGAVGGTIGRNIWQADNPAAMPIHAVATMTKHECKTFCRIAEHNRMICVAGFARIQQSELWQVRGGVN